MRISRGAGITAGLTRAKKHLLLTWDRNRKRSQFLDELDPQSDQPARRGRGRRPDPPPPTKGKRPKSKMKVRKRAPSEPSIRPRLREDSWRPF